MRAILAAGMLLLCLSGVGQESDDPRLLSGSFHIGDGRSFASLVEIESSRARGDRASTPRPIETNFVAVADAVEQAPAPAETQGLADPAEPGDPAPAATANAFTHQPPNSGAADSAPAVPLDQLCGALLSSAQDNDLPVAFFANLIWQESRLRDDAVSPKGALGIAQFMPKVAMASGLENPFDPLQALAASAHLLRELRAQFGNLGLVAAAYNAGAKRVSEWLQRGRTLPRETRFYVIDITGRSVEQWQQKPPQGDDVHFLRRLPCRDVPAFAELEQAQEQQRAKEQQSQSQRPDAPHAKAVTARAQEAKPAEKLKAAETAVPRAKRTRTAKREHPRAGRGHEKARIAERDRGRREAKVRVRRAVHAGRRGSA